MKVRLWPIIYPVCILLFAALGFFSARSAEPVPEQPTPNPTTYFVSGDTVTAIPFSVLTAEKAEADALAAPELLELPEETVQEDDWRLILINPWNPLPEGYIDTVTLQEIGDGFLLDSRACEDLEAMLEAMRAAGLEPTINSAYRSHEYQTQLHENKVADYEAEGYSPEEAEALASQWVAVPGTSEHEAALAVDISMYEDASAEVHLWLQQNSWQYGFIYRYPEDRLEVTGIQPEPWHYRYVGRENAESIYASGLTLEEYISSFDG